jgi:hypothetical protein
MKKINIYLIIMLLGLCLCSCTRGNKSADSSNDTTFDNTKHQALVPPDATNKSTVQPSAHPLAEKINRFLSVEEQPEGFTFSGLDKKGYLKIIDGQVRAMKQYQDDDGRIIDPVENVEKYYTTPCYAHSVAALVASSYIKKDDELALSGM